MLDGDEAGLRAAGEMAGRLAHKTWAHVVELPKSKQPDQISIDELQELLGKL